MTDDAGPTGSAAPAPPPPATAAGPTGSAAPAPPPPATDAGPEHEAHAGAERPQGPTQGIVPSAAPAGRHRRHGPHPFAHDARTALPPDESGRTVPAVARHRRLVAVHSFNPRLALVRLLSAGLTVLATVIVTPGLRFVDLTWWRLALVAVLFGVLNAVAKPVLQFFVLRFIISTYGLVVVLINMLLLYLLDLLSEGFIDIENWLGLVLGGVLIGVLSLVFDTLLGANPPMLDDRYDAAGRPA